MKSDLSAERKARLVSELTSYYHSEFDEELNVYRATAIIDFMIAQIGPAQYNQAITDACKYMSRKIEDLDTEFFMPEDQ